MAEERIDSIIDLAAVKKEFDTVMSYLDELGAAIKGSGNPSGAGSLTQSFAERKAAMKDLQAETEKMVTAEKKLETQLDAVTAAAKDAMNVNKESVAATKAYNGTLDENIKLQVQYKSRLSEIRKEQKELEKGFTGTAGAVKQYQERMVQLVKEEREVQVASLELNTIVRNQVKELNAAGNSLNELRSQLNQMKAAADNLDIGSKEFIDAQKAIGELNSKIKALEFSRGDFQRDVGNYAGSFRSAFDTLQSELDQTRQKMKELQASGQEGSSAFAQLAKEEALLSELTNGLNKAFGSTKAEFRALQEAAKKMGIELGATNETFQKFVSEVGSAKDDLDDLGNIIKQNASDTQALDGLISAAQGLAGAYGVATGAAELFGDGNEDLQKKMTKFMAIMQVLQGLQAIQNALQKEGAAMQSLLAAKTYIVTAAQKAYTFATNIAITATNSLKAAIASTGIGALLIVLGLFVSKMAEAAENTDQATKSLKDFDAALDNIKISLESDIELIELNTKRNTERVKQRAGSEKEISDITKKQLEEQMDAYSRNTSDIIKLENELQDERIRLAKSGGASQEDFDKIDDQISKARAARLQNNNNLVKASFELQIEAEKQRTKAADDARKSAKASSEARIIDMEREAAVYNAIVSDEQASYSQRLSALDQFYTKQKQIAAAKASNDLSQPNLTGGERQKIAAERNKTLAELERNFNKTKESIIKEGAIKALQIQTELIQMEMGLVKKKTDSIVSDENMSLAARMSALEEFNKAEIAIITANYNLRKQEAKGNKDQLLLIEKDYETQILTLTIDTNTRVTEIIRQETEKQKRIKEDLRQFDIELANDVYAMLEKDATIAYSKEVIALNKALKDKEITIDEYNKRREKLDQDLAGKSLQNEIKNTRELLRYAKDGTQEKYNLEKKLKELEIKADDEATQKQLANMDKIKEGKKQLVGELKNLVISLIEGGYDREKNALEDQISAIEKNKQAEIDRVNSSTISEQEKADKIKIIESKAAADSEILERKKKEVDIKKAKFERDRTIFEIAANTAIAISKAVASFPLTGGMPFAAIAAAIGAVQIAAVLARPLPKFEKGTLSAPEGYAITDEKGPEMYIEPGGNTYIGSDKGPTIRYLKRGTRVIPTDQVNKIMLDSMMSNTAGVLSPQTDNQTAKEVRGLKDVMYWQTKELQKAYGKQKSPKVNIIVRGGWDAYISKSVRE